MLTVVKPRRSALKTPLRVALLSCMLAPAVRAEPKIGYVDVQRALLEVEEGKAARARVEGLADAAKKKMEPERIALMKEKTDFEKQSATMSPAARNERGTSLERRMLDFNEKLQKSSAEVDAEQRKEVEAIMSKLQPVIATIAEREGMTVIFDKTRSGLVYAPDSFDLTNEVIRAYNAHYQKPGESSKPAKAAESAKPPAPSKKKP